MVVHLASERGAALNGRRCIATGPNGRCVAVRMLDDNTTYRRARCGRRDRGLCAHGAPPRAPHLGPLCTVRANARPPIAPHTPHHSLKLCNLRPEAEATTYTPPHGPGVPEEELLRRLGDAADFNFRDHGDATTSGRDDIRARIAYVRWVRAGRQRARARACSMAAEAQPHTQPKLKAARTPYYKCVHPCPCTRRFEHPQGST